MLIVGIIADPVHGAALRLLKDLVRLQDLEPALRPLHVVLLENPSTRPLEASGRQGHRDDAFPPSDGPQTGRTDGWQHALTRACVDGLLVECITPARQAADASDGLFGTLRLEPGRQPIATARTMLQRYVALRCLRTPRAVAWILDEDLRLTPLLAGIERGTASLSRLIHDLRAHRADVAISPILGAPPLPSRSSIRVNLTDVLRHLERMARMSPFDHWPDHREDNSRVRARYPDYYYDFTHAHADSAEAPIWLEPLHPGETTAEVFGRLCRGVDGLRFGQPLTWGVHETAVMDLAFSKTLARGGNTLVLSPGLFNEIPNLAPRIGGRCTRRSDMVWARLAALVANARIVRVSIPVEQDRSGPGVSNFDTAKLLDDLRGSALIAAMDRALELGAWHEDHVLTTRPSPASLHAALETYELHRARRLNAIRESEIRVLALISRLKDHVERWTREGHWFAASAPGRPAELLKHALCKLEEEYEVAGLLHEAVVSVPCDREERETIESFLECLLMEVQAFRRSGWPSPDTRLEWASVQQAEAIGS